MLGSNPTRDNQVRTEAIRRVLLDFQQDFFIAGLLLASHASKTPIIRLAVNGTLQSSKVVLAAEQ